jgi:hypothetical protein
MFRTVPEPSVPFRSILFYSVPEASLPFRLILHCSVELHTLPEPSLYVLYNLYPLD